MSCVKGRAGKGTKKDVKGNGKAQQEREKERRRVIRGKGELIVLRREGAERAKTKGVLSKRTGRGKENRRMYRGRARSSRKGRREKEG